MPTCDNSMLIIVIRSRNGINPRDKVQDGSTKQTQSTARVRKLQPKRNTTDSSMEFRSLLKKKRRKRMQSVEVLGVFMLSGTKEGKRMHGIRKGTKWIGAPEQRLIARQGWNRISCMTMADEANASIVLE